MYFLRYQFTIQTFISNCVIKCFFHIKINFSIIGKYSEIFLNIGLLGWLRDEGDNGESLSLN